MVRVVAARVARVLGVPVIVPLPRIVALVATATATRSELFSPGVRRMRGVRGVGGVPAMDVRRVPPAVPTVGVVRLVVHLAAVVVLVVLRTVALQP